MTGGIPFSSIGSYSYASNSNPDEYCLDFSLPFPCTVGGLGSYINQSGGAYDYSMILYEGTTQRAIVSIDGNTERYNYTSQREYPVAAAYSIAKDTTYSLAVRPDSTNAVAWYYLNLNNANHRQALPTPWDTAAVRSRVDAGVWSAQTTTIVPLGWVGVTALDNGAGGAGIGALVGGSLTR